MGPQSNIIGALIKKGKCGNRHHQDAVSRWNYTVESNEATKNKERSLKQTLPWLLQEELTLPKSDLTPLAYRTERQGIPVFIPPYEIEAEVGFSVEYIHKRFGGFAPLAKAIKKYNDEEKHPAIPFPHWM